MFSKRRTTSSLTVFFAAVLATIAVASASVSIAATDDNIRFTVPVGGDTGVTYRGTADAKEQPLSGPQAFCISNRGLFAIADTYGRSIKEYSSDGSLLRTIRLPKGVAAIADIECVDDGYYFLDVAGLPPRIWTVDSDGKAIPVFTIPKALREGATGLLRGADGQVRLEIEDGAQVVSFSRTTGGHRTEKTYRSKPQSPSGGDDDQSASVAFGGRTVVLSGDGHPIIGSAVLGTHAGNGFAVLTTQLGADQDGSLLIESKVQLVGDNDQISLAARVPLEDMYATVAHPIAIDPTTGEVFVIVPGKDRVEIRVLAPVPPADLPTILPAQVPLLQPSEPQATAELLSVTCLSRSSIISNASAFRNSYTYLSSTNIGGTCSGRGKPRYLSSTGWYPSVPYDWGGFDSVSDFRARMASGYQAGDINTDSSEGCSRGVDCSGFISRVWSFTTKLSTNTIPNVSSALPSTAYLQPGDVLNKAGAHVVLFDGFASGGIYTWESTTWLGFDRVVHVYSPWSRLSGYVPRRFIYTCMMN